jgi:hypothetical protein
MFFSINNQNILIENKTKSKSAKALFRDRSKSKIMAKILANTF